VIKSIDIERTSEQVFDTVLSHELTEDLSAAE